MFFCKFAWGCGIENGRDFGGSYCGEKHSTISGKFGAKFGAKFGTKSRKIRELSFYNFSDLDLCDKEFGGFQANFEMTPDHLPPKSSNL